MVKTNNKNSKQKINKKQKGGSSTLNFFSTLDFTLNNIIKVLVLILLPISIYYIFNLSNKNSASEQEKDSGFLLSQSPLSIGSSYLPKLSPGTASSNIPSDIYLNPYAPPLNNPLTSSLSYNQVGYIKPSEGDSSVMLPLFAKEKDSRTDKWNYYTLLNGIKVAVYSNDKTCLSEYGCPELLGGDTVKIEDNNTSSDYTVTIYDDKDGLTYSPYI